MLHDGPRVDKTMLETVPHVPPPHALEIGISRDTTASASSREMRLFRLSQGLENPVLIIQGQSGSGKSSVLRFLSQIGVESAVRLLPRHTRAGDAQGDRPWTVESKRVGDREFDPNSGDKQLFAHHLYSGWYGFPAREFVRLYRRGALPALIVGRAEEIPPLIEAVRNLLPGVPVLPLRLEVQAQILEDRLVGRPEAFAGELLERTQAVHKHHAADRPQLTPLVRNYGLRTLINLGPSECQDLGVHPDQLRPIDANTLPSMMNTFIEDAKARAARVASHVVADFNLDYSHRYIPPALVDVLDNHLALQADRMGFPVCIKGGLAVGIYLENSRPVSLDIDFTAPQSGDLEKRLGDLLLAVTGKECECKDAWNKKVYHVRGFGSSLISPKYGEDVELDALVLTRVQPGNTGFCYEFTFDSSDFYMRRTLTLPSGRTVFLVPPEQVIIEKLAAGRGPELGKFDLYDVAGLVATVPLDTVAFRKLLDFHFFNPALDRDAQELLFADGVEPDLRQALDLLGVKAADLIKVAGRFQNDLSHGFSSRCGSQPMTLDVLKRLVLVDRINASLNRILQELDHPWKVGDQEVTLASRFGRVEIERGVSALQSIIHAYAAFELGKDGVVFPRRQHVPGSVREVFFAGLDEQRQRLSNSRK